MHCGHITAELVPTKASHRAPERVWARSHAHLAPTSASCGLTWSGKVLFGDAQ